MRAGERDQHGHAHRDDEPARQRPAHELEGIVQPAGADEMAHAVLAAAHTRAKEQA